MRDVLNHVTGGADDVRICVPRGVGAPTSSSVQLMMGDNLGTDYKASFHRRPTPPRRRSPTPGAADKMVKLPFGEMPAGMAINIAIFDVATHAWDLAKGTGQSMQLDPEVLAIAYQLAQAMLPTTCAPTACSVRK